VKGPRSIRAVLIAARKLLLDKGWVQGFSRETDEDTGEVIGFCASGAICEAVQGRKRVAEETLAFFARSLPSRYPDEPPRLNISVFNDCKTRTKHQVLDAFSRAIQIAPRKVIA
jgi:hypothetical protein